MTLVRLHNDDWGYETNCFVCEQRNERGLRIPFFHDLEAGLVVAELELGHAYSGAPTLLHGGIVLAVLDEAMAWATIALAGRWALTAETSCRFVAPVAVDVAHRIEAEVVADDGDRLGCAARVLTAGGDLCTEATASFVVVGEATAVRLAGDEIADEHRGYLSDDA
ncbi:MAG: PaaI family thioesterase [Actinomycetota bacterium]